MVLRKLAVAAAIFGLAFVTSNTQAQQHSELVVVDVQSVFVPNGFDDNDEALAVVDGYLPDSCHRIAHTDVQFDQTTSTFQVVQYARRFNVPCLPAIVPFFKEAGLGVIPYGDYSVASPGAETEAMHIAEAGNSGPDDYFYAPIDTARVERDGNSDRYFAVINGRFTNTCMRWQEVRLINSGKTMELLPIIEMEDRGEECADVVLPFSYMVDIPEQAAGRYLLHVRSLNGKSINNVYSVYR